MEKRILLIWMLLSSLVCVAQGEQDTVYFYTSWHQVMNSSPEAMIVDPWLDMVSFYEIHFETGLEKVNREIRQKYIAASLGDIWFINTQYLKDHFMGDTNTMNGFTPLYFNDKTAFVVAPRPLTIKDILFGSSDDGVTSDTPPDYYYIDFFSKHVKRVTHEYLSTLLEDYHDLKMRYEGMKDYKKPERIEDYFYKYIDRVTDDFMKPYILDIVDE